MPTALPVDEIRDTFSEHFQDAKKPLIITAPTGSGKSTRLPLWMRDEGSSPRANVLVIEPRRVACRALATYLSEQAGTKVGEEIGYSVRFENRRSEKTRVLFVTPGVALRLLSSRDIAFESVLIDEFHERGWEVDLVAAIIRTRRQEAIKAGKAPLKFVVTSATLDAESLKASLGADLLEARGRTYPVDIEHQGGAAMPSREDLDVRVERAVRRALSDGTDGEVLVFLPGKGEIASVARQLAALNRHDGAKVEVLEVHASLPMKRLMRVFEPPKQGIRRVFLATNVAETSLTLPGVTWVIDAGLVRMQVHRAGKTALSLLPTSQASMDQRAGRAGRVRPGKCIRLWEERFTPQVSTPPEIERVELDDLVLRAAICGLDISRLEEMPWVTPPPEFAVDTARRRLKALGALDMRGALTPLGEELLALPVSSDAARLLVDVPNELLGTACDLVALMQRGYRLMLRVDHLPQEKRARIIEARTSLLDGVEDEVFEAITVLRHGDASRHHLHAVGLKETRKISASLRDLVRCRSRTPERDKAPLPSHDALAAHLLSRAPEMGFVMRERAQKKGKRPPKKKHAAKPWGNGEVEVFVTDYRPFGIEQKPHYKPPTMGVLCDHTWLGDSKGYGARGRGSLLLPCSARVLARHARTERHIGQIKLSSPRRSPRVEAIVTRELAGVTLSSGQEKLEGEALREAVASLVMENRLFKGAGERVADALHLLSILAQWPGTVDTAHWDLDRLHALSDTLATSPEVYIASKLEELGLEQSEELELIEPEDLTPDIAALTGLYEPELDALKEDFPRIWEHQGARYVCEVHPRQRRVELQPVNKTARQGKEPSSSVLPRFQGYRVRYRQASRVVTLRG